MKWISLHVYYSGSLSILLTKGIYPSIKDLFKKGDIDQFFFIRYFEKGPHIRIRVRIINDPDYVISFLSANINQYMNSVPSSYGDVKKDDWYPNNSIQPIDYEPEVIRYGGYFGIEIAEKHFMYSSQLVIDYFMENPYVNKDIVKGFALKIHLIFIFIFCEGDIDKMKRFTKYLYFITSNTYKNNINNEDLNNFFDVQKNKLASFVKNLFEHLGVNHIFKDDITNEWIFNTKNIKGILDLADSKNQIEYYPNVKSLDSENLWLILFSYIHMTYNRLGIHNLDEVVLNYIIMRTMEEYM